MNPAPDREQSLQMHESVIKTICLNGKLNKSQKLVSDHSDYSIIDHKATITKQPMFGILKVHLNDSWIKEEISVEIIKNVEPKIYAITYNKIVKNVLKIYSFIYIYFKMRKFEN